MAKATGISYKDVLKSFQKGEFPPLVLLHGEEDYFIDLLSDYVEAHALEESQRAFNQTVVYGRDITAGKLIDMALRLPMMAPRQVIIVREAQDIPDFYKLESYLGKPAPTTLLVLCHKHKKVDGRKAVINLISKSGIVFESNKLYDDKIPDWIRQWLKDEGYDIAPDALALAHEYLGNSLNTITNQFSKLFPTLSKGMVIEAEHVRSNIDISREYNVFELQKALGSRQTEKAHLIAREMGANPKSQPLVMIIGSLGSYFTKLYTLVQMPGARDDEMAKAIKINPFLLRDYKPAMRAYNTYQLEHIFGLLRDFDYMSKGLGSRKVTPAELLRELVYRILNA